MKYLFVCCEGTTEESFVENLLVPYFNKMGVYVTTSGMKGISNFDNLKKHIIGYCLSYPNALVTTMIDYYGLQKIMPSFIPARGNIYERVQLAEKKVMQNFRSLNNLYFNIILHEFEGLLFSDVMAFDDIANTNQLQELLNIRSRVATPEHINDQYETAPSRRIKNNIPVYLKIRNGIEIARRIGLEKITEECIHFRQWINYLTVWAKEDA